MGAQLGIVTYVCTSCLLCGILHAAVDVKLNVSLSLEEPGKIVEVQMTEAMALCGKRNETVTRQLSMCSNGPLSKG